MAKPRLQKYFSVERFGLSMSFLCGVHCLAFPFLVTLSPILPVHLEGFESIEKGIILVSLLIAAFTFAKDYKKHTKLFPILLAVSAACLFVFSGFLMPKFESVFVSGGSILLLFAYVLNWRMKKTAAPACICAQV
jgi:hypothetical protein